MHFNDTSFTISLSKIQIKFSISKKNAEKLSRTEQ